ncbi:MAG: sugar porter family MFS transporter [Planctomycetota bacterium]|nr:sugar porter family MFS transporter [Planctomycetota bacterium]MDG1985956.1 sugar porter family MFS transporter [Planctomycetota bacterium]
MNDRSNYTLLVSLTVALGGFLMGFDSAVISGVVDPLKSHFDLTPGQVGTAVACLTAGATLAMAVAGRIADALGRKPVLIFTAALFSVSALWSAFAGSYTELVIARVIGGFGVGGALLIAPMYIAEIAPPEKRGRLVSFNQLNIVLGFSAAFFSNYFLEQYFKIPAPTPANPEAMVVDPTAWRWMLGVEAIPAVLYLASLLLVPRSPRWLAIRGRFDEARTVLAKTGGEASADAALAEVRENLSSAKGDAGYGELFASRMRLVMLIGLGLGFFQQITGINAIFYYATTIFELTGAGRDASLIQAIYVGLVNVAFTLIAMRLIDKAGRKPLLLVGTAAMTIALFTNAYAFNAGSYQLSGEKLSALTESVAIDVAGPELTVNGTAAASAPYMEGASAALAPLTESYGTRNEFIAAVDQVAAAQTPYAESIGSMRQGLPMKALQVNGKLILAAILLYIAAFAISLGPVMWAMFSEIFPARMRGVAISAAGFFNSLVSYAVQKLFPSGLAEFGPAGVFLFFGVFAALAFLFSLKVIPETKGKSLEELEAQLIG